MQSENIDWSSETPSQFIVSTKYKTLCKKKSREASDIMILRTDTIGHFEHPKEIDIRSAISYAGENASNNDLVKLMIDDENYICIWIGNKRNGHTLELRYNSVKKTCKEKFDSEKAIQTMIKYLHCDLSWFNDYIWEKSQSQKLMESMTLLANQMNKTDPEV